MNTRTPAFPKDEARTALLLTAPEGAAQEEALGTLVAMLADPKAADRAVRAISAHKGPVHARLIPAVAEVIRIAPESSVFVMAMFERHHADPRVHEAVTRTLEGFAERNELPKDAYAHQIYNSHVDEVRFPSAAPALAKLLVISAREPGWPFFGNLLNGLGKLKDPATLETLQSVLPGLKGGHRKATLAVIKAIEGKGKAPAKSQPKASSDDALVQRLLDAGLSAERARDLRKLVRCRIEARTRPSGAFGLGASRFGGSPDLPEGMAWPTAQVGESEYEPQADEEQRPVKGKYTVALPFLAQIALADLATHDLDGLLPKEGMLWFFAHPDARIGEWQDLQKMASRVLYEPEPKNLTPFPAPSNLGKVFRYLPTQPEFSRGQPLPPSHVEAVERQELSEEESKAYEKACAADESKGEAPHALLGWAEAGYFRGLPAAKDQLLLAVRSDPASGFSFGDQSAIYFCIPSAALKKREFSKAFCVHDE